MNLANHPRQQGLALVCALMLMLAAMLLGVSVARAAFGSVASARQERDRMVARAAAEAGLRDAEQDIAGGARLGGTQPSSARAGWFAAPAGGGFAEGCGRGNQDLGLCLPAAPALPAVWETVDLADQDNPVVVPYGQYTGATFAVGGGILPARLPAYLIERLELAGAAAQAGRFYRITAIGFGTRPTTRVVLQSIYRKPPPVTPAASAAGEGEAPSQAQQPTLPAGRIGWRDIANWPELHARATE
jgi:type IV pilus assembly protein PilX